MPNHISTSQTNTEYGYSAWTGVSVVSWTEDDYRALMRGRTAQAFAEAKAAKPSKYRNVKTVADGQTFDSRREADYWLLLKSREQLGEITGLRRQVRYELTCPGALSVVGQKEWPVFLVVAHYIADFVYQANGVTHVVDAKGKRTQMYQLKKKWLELQTGIVIQEV